jgi:hypothetical protein
MKHSVDAEQLGKQHIAAVHVVNWDEVETVEPAVPEFTNAFTFQVPDSNPNISDSFQKLLELDLLREEAIIEVAGQPVSRNNHNTIPAATAASASLSNVNFSLEGFDVTLASGGTGAGTVTVSNALGGTMVYDMPVGATSLSVRYPQPLRNANAGVPIQVTVSAIVGGGAGHLNLYGSADDGGYAYLCHSFQQASACAQAVASAIASAQTVASFPVPGALIAYGNYRIRGSAPVWIMPGQNTQLTVSVMEIRRAK